jgi:protein arginine kinase
MMKAADTYPLSSRWLSGNWYADDVLVCCEAKISRNIRHTAFSCAASADDRNRIRGIFNQCYAEIGGHDRIDMYDIGDDERQMVIENRMASADFSSNQPFSCIFYNPSDGSSVCVNDRDHVRIRSVGSTAWEALANAQSEESDLVSHGLDFAYRKDFGFLTSHYEESGSGMRLSAVMRLPAVNLLSMALPLSLHAAVSKVTMSRAFGPSGSKGYFCDMVQMHVDPPTMAHVERSVKNLHSVIDMAMEKEFECRETLLSDDAAMNLIGFSWGSLTNLVSIDYDIAGTAISHAVLAIKLGMTGIRSKEKTVKRLRDSVAAVMPGHLAVSHGAGNLERKRADLLRTILRSGGEFCLK